MNIECEGEFVIQEIGEDPIVARLYQHEEVDSPDARNRLMRRRRKDVSEPSLRNHKDEHYSDQATRRVKNGPGAKMFKRFEKNIRKNREKAYILMLENKVQTLEKEINKLKAINRANQ